MVIVKPPAGGGARPLARQFGGALAPTPSQRLVARAFTVCNAVDRSEPSPAPRTRTVLPGRRAQAYAVNNGRPGACSSVATTGGQDGWLTSGRSSNKGANVKLPVGWATGSSLRTSAQHVAGAVKAELKPVEQMTVTIDTTPRKKKARSQAAAPKVVVDADTAERQDGDPADLAHEPFAVEVNRRPDMGFMSAVSAVKSEAEWVDLVKGRDMSRSAVELGAALFALRRVQRDTKSLTVSRSTGKLLLEYKRVLTANMANMPPRSIANAVSAIVGLKHADKLLMLRMALVVQKRLKENPHTFKLPELSQLCWACREMGFKHLGLMHAVSKSIRLMPPTSMNPVSLVVLFMVIPDLDFYDPKLTRFMLDQVGSMPEALTVTDIKTILSGCARMQVLDAKDQYNRLQRIVRQKLRGSMDRASALTIMIALLHLEALQPETISFMTACLAEDSSDWSKPDLLSLSALIGCMIVQGIKADLGLSPELLLKAYELGSSQEIRISSTVEAVQNVLREDLGLEFRSIRSRQGWGVPIFVGDKYAVFVVSNRQYLQNTPSRLNGQVTLVLRSLQAESIVPVVVHANPAGKEMMWTGPNSRRFRKQQAEYLRSCLPPEVLEFANGGTQ